MLTISQEAEKALQENEVERARLDEHIKEMEAELGVCDDDIERIHEKEAKFLPRTTQKKVGTSCQHTHTNTSGRHQAAGRGAAQVR